MLRSIIPLHHQLSGTHRYNGKRPFAHGTAVHAGITAHRGGYTFMRFHPSQRLAPNPSRSQPHLHALVMPAVPIRTKAVPHICRRMECRCIRTPSRLRSAAACPAVATGTHARRLTKQPGRLAHTRLPAGRAGGTHSGATGRPAALQAITLLQTPRADRCPHRCGADGFKSSRCARLHYVLKPAAREQAAPPTILHAASGEPNHTGVGTSSHCLYCRASLEKTT